jgi:GntR family transcriptional regulator
MVEPMYRQIADDLRYKIESGEIPHGAQLPTETELMDEYNASRNTVRDAIKLLTAWWLVETRAGKGTYVAGEINPFVSTLTGEPDTGGTDVYLAAVTAEGRVPVNSRPRVEIQHATGLVASALHVEPGTSVVSRHQRCFIDGTPWSLQTSFYPMKLVEAGATRLRDPADIEEGAVKYIAKVCDIKQAGYRDSIAVRPINEREAAFFKLPDDGPIPVFEIFRVAFDGSGKRFRLTITVYPADRNRFAIEVGDVPIIVSVDPGEGSQ